MLTRLCRSPRGTKEAGDPCDDTAQDQVGQDREDEGDDQDLAGQDRGVTVYSCGGVYYQPYQNQYVVVVID